MKFIVCDQGTPEWLQARAGAITASCFADALSTVSRASGERKAGDFSAASDKYAANVAIERISGKPYGEPVKAWVLDRGHELEVQARLLYETRTGLVAMESGIVKTDDDWFGYSSDGMVNATYLHGAIIDCTGLIEVKCPIDSLKILYIWRTGDLSEYMHQMQGGMWITGAKWCDFIMYVPDLANCGKDLYVKRVMRDDDFIETMETGLLAFRSRIQDIETLLLK
jgi:YqaJ-like viral recombinase domain